MKTTINKVIAFAAMAGVLTSLLGCKCIIRPVQTSSDGRLVILQEPQSQTVPLNSTVNFSVVAMHVGPPSTNVITYQWRFNGVAIAGATSSTYTIASAQITDAGDYSVLVTGSSLLSDSASLAVYEPSANGGTLTVGISSFKSGNNGQACFPTAQGWDRYYVLVGYLLGPNVSPLPNPNPFPNPGNVNSVTIDTIDALNGSTLDTGIVINYEFSPNDKICNDDMSPPNPPNTHLSKATYSSTGSGRRYRATVFYKSASNPPANVSVHWNYP